MAETIAVLSQKGGTGKTTTVRTLADVLRRCDLRVLAIDLDPQGNLSDYFDVPPDAEPTISDVLAGRVTLTEAAREGVVPANLRLAETELALAGRMGRELSLRRALRDVRDSHDVILIDCPPALGLLTVNGLVAADHALISAEAQHFALQGVVAVLDMLEVARDLHNERLAWLGVVLNIADMRTVHSRETLAALREEYGEKVFDTTIRPSIAYAESAERGISILDHRPDLAEDYLALAGEVLDRLGLAEPRRRLARLRGR
jgi:chromosome partitioning protein